MATLGEIIREFRETHEPRISLRKFAEMSNLSFSYVSMLERNLDPRGNPIVPTITTINKVAEAIGKPFDEVFNALDPESLVKVNATVEPPDYDDYELDFHITDSEKYLKLHEIAVETFANSKEHQEQLHKIREIYAHLFALNDEGIENVQKYINMMVKSGEYKKED